MSNTESPKIFRFSHAEDCRCATCIGINSIQFVHSDDCCCIKCVSHVCSVHGEQIEPAKAVPVTPKASKLSEVFDGAKVKAIRSRNDQEEVDALKSALKACWATMDDKNKAQFFDSPVVAEIASHANIFCQEDVDEVVDHVLEQQIKYGFQNDQSDITECVTEYAALLDIILTPHGFLLACERVLEGKKND